MGIGLTIGLTIGGVLLVYLIIVTARNDARNAAQRRLERQRELEAKAEAFAASLDSLGLVETTAGRREAQRGALHIVLEQQEFGWQARIAGSRRWLPPGVERIWALSGYARYESGTYADLRPTGDRTFDNEYLVFPEGDAVPAVPTEIRAILLSHVIDGLQILPQELTLWLSGQQKPDERPKLLVAIELAERLQSGT